MAPGAQEFVFNLLGLCVMGRTQPAPWPRRPVPTRVFLTVLGALGVSDAATRAALNRMVARAALARHRAGRTSCFEPTDGALEMMRRGRARMFSATPFDHAENLWTILNCPIPESLRKVRYQVNARLQWAGFGLVQANMWVAPGRVDIMELLGDIFPADALNLVQAFHGTPAAPNSAAHLARTAWDIEALRAAHLGFAQRWGSADPPADEALPQLLQLIGDWGRLVRADPGLPAAHLGDDWPACESTRIFRRLETRLGPAADAQLECLLS